jgi:hypothetical protein
LVWVDKVGEALVGVDERGFLDEFGVMDLVGDLVGDNVGGRVNDFINFSIASMVAVILNDWREFVDETAVGDLVTNTLLEGEVVDLVLFVKLVWFNGICIDIFSWFGGDSTFMMTGDTELTSGKGLLVCGAEALGKGDRSIFDEFNGWEIVGIDVGSWLVATSGVIDKLTDGSFIWESSIVNDPVGESGMRNIADGVSVVNETVADGSTDDESTGKEEFSLVLKFVGISDGIWFGSRTDEDFNSDGAFGDREGTVFDETPLISTEGSNVASDTDDGSNDSITLDCTIGGDITRSLVNVSFDPPSKIISSNWSSTKVSISSMGKLIVNSFDLISAFPPIGKISWLGSSSAKKSLINNGM